MLDRAKIKAELTKLLPPSKGEEAKKWVDEYQPIAMDANQNPLPESEEQRQKKFFLDLARAYPQIVYILGALARGNKLMELTVPSLTRGFKATFELPANMSHKEICVRFSLFPLEEAKRLIRALPNSHALVGYIENYYNVLKNEFSFEVATRKACGNKKLDNYQAAGWWYYCAIKFICEHPQPHSMPLKKEMLDKVYHQVCGTTWISTALKLAALTLITALGAAIGFAIGAAVSGGIAAVPGAVKGAMLASTWTMPLIIGSSAGATVSGGLTALGLFRKNSFEKATQEFDQSVRNYLEGTDLPPRRRGTFRLCRITC